MFVWKSDFYLALFKYLINRWVKAFSTSKFDSHLHGGSFFSHSVRSPLTTLQVCLSELEQMSKEKGGVSISKNKIVQSYLESAFLATKQINSLVDGATAKNPYEKIHLINVSEVFNQLQTFFSHRGENSKLVFSINLISGKEVIKMNKYFFFELMQCLLNNALEAYKKRAKTKLVFVTAICKNKKLEIQVQDFGEGSNFLMAKLMLSRGFTTKKNGHGFGLQFVKDVLETQGKSKLKIFSEKNYGTIVRFSLPLF